MPLMDFAEALAGATTDVDELFRQSEQAYLRCEWREVQQKLLAVLRLQPDHVGALIRIGMLQTAARQFDQARGYLVKALAHAGEHKSRHEEYLAHNALGNLEFGLRNPSRALTQYTAARDAIGRRASASDLGRIENNIGNSLWQMGDRRQAIRHFKEAIRFAARDPRDVHLGVYYWNLGSVHRELGHIGRASRFLKQAKRFIDRYVAANPAFKEQTEDASKGIVI